MTLKRWLAKKKMSQNAFAELTGLSQSAISKYLAGDRQPTVDCALLIQRATDGDVGVEEWEGVEKVAS